MPVVSAEYPLRVRLSELDRLCAEAGRDRVPVTAAIFGIDEQLIEQCAQLGVSRCVIAPPVGDDLAGLQPFVDRCSRIATSYR